MGSRPRFKDREGYQIPNHELWLGLHDIILQLESLGTRVEFWRIEGKETEWAAGLAESVFLKKLDILELQGWECFEYFREKGSKLYEVKRLAKEMCLELPKEDTSGNKANVKYVLRRLVLTSNDTEENFGLFFGDKWDDPVKGIRKLWAQARRSVLRSLKEKDAGKKKWFVHELPGFLWNIRPASQKEAKQVAEHIAERSKKNKKAKLEKDSGRRASLKEDTLD